MVSYIQFRSGVVEDNEGQQALLKSSFQRAYDAWKGDGSRHVLLDPVVISESVPAFEGVVDRWFGQDFGKGPTDKSYSVARKHASPTENRFLGVFDIYMHQAEGRKGFGHRQTAPLPALFRNTKLDHYLGGFDHAALASSILSSDTALDEVLLNSLGERGQRVRQIIATARAVPAQSKGAALARLTGESSPLLYNGSFGVVVIRSGFGQEAHDLAEQLTLLYPHSTFFYVDKGQEKDLSALCSTMLDFATAPFVRGEQNMPALYRKMAARLDFDFLKVQEYLKNLAGTGPSK
ncbi:hypothetical protein HYV86_04915 [Candidatus Woesearchaeota archaeon]|nr:hypothetical protein [Candidatus Woesearchaeota archaeon]